MNTIERINKSCEYIGVAQTGIIAFQFLYLWLFAGVEEAYQVYAMAILMAFEFIMVHSGVFMSVMPKKYSLFVFFPLYGLFAYAFDQMMGESDYTVIIIYLTTVLNRMRFAFFNASKEMKNEQVFMSVIAVIGYFFLLVGVVLVGKLVPEFALGDSFTASEVYREVSAKSGGLFIDKPSLPICLGFLYYSFLSYVNYRVARGVQFLTQPIREKNEL